jgi:hypothetical protein
MKKSFFILIFISAVYSCDAQQRFRAGAKLGLSTSQVDGDTYSGYNKAGVDGGIFVNSKLTTKWTAQMEMIFIQKGSKHVGNRDNGDYSDYLLQLNYIEVPVLFQYHMKKISVETGLSFAYLINEREYNTFQELTGLRPHSKIDGDYDLGFTYTIFKNLDINWRYSYSFLSIRNYVSGAKRWYNPGERNNVLAFTLTYTFGGARTE